jgi:hypothetical protein
MSKNRVKRRTLVNTVMNLRVSLKTGDLFPSWTTINFSKNNPASWIRAYSRLWNIALEPKFIVQSETSLREGSLNAGTEIKKKVNETEGSVKKHKMNVEKQGGTWKGKKIKIMKTDGREKEK